MFHHENLFCVYNYMRLHSYSQRCFCITANENPATEFARRNMTQLKQAILFLKSTAFENAATRRYDWQDVRIKPLLPAGV